MNPLTTAQQARAAARKRNFAAVLAVAAILPWPDTTLADAGHGAAPATTAAQPRPRFSAESDSFELVGVLSGRRLVLYLDHHADNSPVRDATLTLDVGGQRVVAAAHDGNAYEATLPEAPSRELIPVVASVSAGGVSDLLAAELDLRPVAHDAPSVEPAWRHVVAWTAGILLTLLPLGWFLRRAISSRIRHGGLA